MKKLLLFLLAFFVFTFSTFSANHESSLIKSEILDAIFEAKINVEEYAEVGKPVLFDTTESKILDIEEYGEPIAD